MNEAAVRRKEPHQRSRGVPVVGATAALAIYAAFLVVIRPMTPFEWDEVLFLNAIEGYDVAAQAPHAPGYPVFVALARLATTAVGSPETGCQLVSIIGAVLTVLGTGLLARELGSGRVGAWLAAVLVAAVPAFAFQAPVGLSDVLATGLATVAVWRMVVAAGRHAAPRDVAIAAALAAAAMGVRPQTLIVLAPAAFWLHLKLLRGPRRHEIVLGWLAAAAVTVVCWLPAVLLTGPSRYVWAIRKQREVYSQALGGRTLLDADLGWVLSRWLESPFGAGWLVMLWWILVVIGALAWWFSGRKTLTIIVASTAVSGLLVSASVMECIVAGRYITPVLPWFAVLAAGVTAWPKGWRRVVGSAAATVLIVGWVAWWAPVVHQRSVEPAPLSAGLRWVDAHAPSRSVVVVDHSAIHHARRFLPARGRIVIDRRKWKTAGADPTLPVYQIMVGTFDRPGRTLFRSFWEGDHWQRLSRNRYLECRVVTTDP